MIELTTSGNNVLVSASHFDGFVPDSLMFLGMRSVARGKKEDCTGEYYHTLPIEHTHDFPVEVACDGSQAFFSEQSRIWLTEPLIKALTSGYAKEVEVNVEKLKKAENIIILNCLDSCYGHALDKLFNCQRHLAQSNGLGLIVIIQSSMRCLVPDGVAEIWQLDVPFKTFEHKLKGFDEKVKSRILESNQAYLSRADMNLDYSLLDIPSFVRRSPLPFEKMKKLPYQITFILREDRFWLTCRINQWFYLLARSFRLMPFFKGYFIGVQNRNFRQLARHLFKTFDQVSIEALGIGSSGWLGKHVSDHRVDYADYKTREEERYQIYAASHITIGVHGSHMILPSALSGGFISLHQDYKIAHFSEDYIPRYACPQRQGFLGRFLSDKNKPSVIAAHIEYMLTTLDRAIKTRF